MFATEAGGWRFLSCILLPLIINLSHPKITSLRGTVQWLTYLIVLFLSLICLWVLRDLWDRPLELIRLGYGVDMLSIDVLHIALTGQEVINMIAKDLHISSNVTKYLITMWILMVSLSCLKLACNWVYSLLGLDLETLSSCICSFSRVANVNFQLSVWFQIACPL